MGYGDYEMTLADGSMMPGTVRVTIQDTAEGLIGALSITPGLGEQLPGDLRISSRFMLYSATPIEDFEDQFFQCDPIGGFYDSGGFVVLFKA